MSVNSQGGIDNVFYMMMITVVISYLLLYWAICHATILDVTDPCTVVVPCTVVHRTALVWTLPSVGVCSRDEDAILHHLLLCVVLGLKRNVAINFNGCKAVV